MICAKCGRQMYNGDASDICPACKQGVRRTDWRDDLRQVRATLAREMEKPEGRRSEEYIRACEARIRGLIQAHDAGG